MLRLHWVACLAPLAASQVTPVTPVEKVTTLLEDLKAEVEQEGRTEASTYDEFSCFCKASTSSKSTAITSGRDGIDSLSAEIGEKTAAKLEKISELTKRKGDHEAWTGELQNTVAQCEKDKAEYDAEAADLSKAISSLVSAIKAMKESKPDAGQTLISIGRSMHVSGKASQQAFDLLQTSVDPSDPTYKYRSQGIIETLEKLHTEFSSDKTVLDSEWSKTDLNCKATKESLGNKLSENDLAMTALSEGIDGLKGEIATARESLVNTEALLKDDQLYLKDLTQRCETRAKDWDQRSQMRADELKALSGALAVMKDTVSGLDVAVNKRALFLEKNSTDSPSQSASPQAPMSKKVDAQKTVLTAVFRHAIGPSLLQEQSSRGNRQGLLRGAHAAAALSAQARQDKVVSLLGHEGQRLASSALSSLAARLAADPFTKVKTLIQQLIERLLQEATSEASKKGFCDEELGKARQFRGFRLADAKKLDVEVQGLEIKRDELQEEIALLTEAVDKLRLDLSEATTQRKQERGENLEVVKKAKEGLTAVAQAIDILKVFYNKGAKATVLVQASPVDEDTSGAGFEGAYKGKQQSSHGIIGMLEVIQSDFDRTAKTTEAAEQTAHEEFVEFDRTSKADISGKETKRTLDEEDLETTGNSIVQKMADLTTAQDLLDSALKTLEDLKPTCIDTGMSYEERVQKREDEISALKRAVCILDPEGMEVDCAEQQMR